MRRVTYSLSASIDGYITGPDGGFDWSYPQREVFLLATEEVRGLGAHLLGRRLYETMLYWHDPAVQDTFDDDEREFARLWNALPKIVFSRTLTDVEGDNTRLATGTVAEEVARLRAEPGDGDIGIGGAMLAAEAARSDLIDEYRVRGYPVLVGSGTPFFPRHARQVDLEMLEARPVAGGVVYVRYGVVR